MPRSEILASTAESRTAFHPMEIQIFYIWDYGRVVIGVIVFPFRARQRLIVNGLVMTGVVVSGQGGIIPHFASARTRGNGQLNENKQISTILVSAITWIWALLPEAPEITCGSRRWRQVTGAAGTGCTGKAPVHLLSAVPWQLVYRLTCSREKLSCRVTISSLATGTIFLWTPTSDRLAADSRNLHRNREGSVRHYISFPGDKTPHKSLET